MAALVALSLCGAAACEDGATPRMVEGLIEPGITALAGSWIGSEKITQVADLGGATPADPRGFSFDVALALTGSGRFRLVSTGFPPDGPWVCTGSFSASGGTLRFFPFSACPALPLHTFLMTSRLNGGLLLEAATSPTSGTGAVGGGDIRVRIEVQHD